MTGGRRLHFDACVTLGAFRLEARFETGPGITALFGPSGSGKTTVINLIAGLRRPDRGQILFGGEVLADTHRRVFLKPHLRRIGLVYQDAQLFPHLTVLQNLKFGRWFAPRDADAVPLDKVVETLAIAPLLQRRPAGLSGGEKQRVALARALLSAPRLMLLDEPLASLDANRKAEILPLIEHVRDAFAVPMIYVSHAQDEVRRLAEKVIVLEDGRVIKSGTPQDVFTT